MTDRRDDQIAADDSDGAKQAAPGEDIDDLTADNEVEEDTVATVDPDNAPA
ncbi:hypothetical protein [Microterricola viridarii]|uniref:hypothetical protein n=1 Tax=Microterricola viridarii TaxID=412690 RepID=UPI0013651C2C|nr:hypothetical protein [Microterricola viridarii]